MSNSDEAAAVSNLAIRLAHDGDVAAAIVLHRRAIAIDPVDHRWKFALAGTLINRARIDEAEELLAHCPVSDPVVLAAMAFCKWERGDPRQASGMFRLACRQRKGDTELLTALAHSTLAAGDWKLGFHLHEARARRQALGAPIPK